jgi:hypothetical protein
MALHPTEALDCYVEQEINKLPPFKFATKAIKQQAIGVKLCL